MCRRRLAAALAMSTSPLAAQTALPPTVVAMTGGEASSGNTFSGTFGTPVLSHRGQVAFWAGTAKGDRVFVGTPGQTLLTAAAAGGPPPAGGTYSGAFDNPVLNAAGQVAILASTTKGAGVFAGTPGQPLVAAAATGGAAPGGGIYTAFGAPVFNAGGQVAFWASTAKVSGVFAGTPGQPLLAAAVTGEAGPGGGTYTEFASMALNAGGQVAFQATTSNGAGVFAGSPGQSLVATAVTGGPAPGGGAYTEFANPTFNAGGQVAFWATTSNGTGVFAGTPGQPLTAVAVTGGVAPDGGTYVALTTPRLNAGGQVAFRATTSNGAGVFVGTPGQPLAAVAVTGEPAPRGQAGGGLTFADFPSGLVLNGGGQVAFMARVSGTGVTADSDRGLFAGSPGNLIQVIREGDAVDVDPSAGVLLKIVDDYGIDLPHALGEGAGQGITLTDAGLLVYQLRFTDGTSGIFTSQLTPVPEPAAVGLLAAAGLGLAGWRRAARRL